jgi:hypothetical protein
MKGPRGPSFETAALRPPQDESAFPVRIGFIFILRCGKKIATQGVAGQFLEQFHVTPDRAF